MFSFRQKIFISYIAVFFVFLSGMYPFASYMAKNIATKAMVDRADELIEKIQSAPNNEALVRRLKEQKSQLFFRVSVITHERKVLYDTHMKRLLGPRFSQEYIVDHPEVNEAFKSGVGYNEEYSDLLGQKFSYMAKAFSFHGKIYVMRTSFPYKYVIELLNDVEIGVIALAALALLLFSLMTWFIVHHFTSPIQEIIRAVKPYQEGAIKELPEIHLRSSMASDEFKKLADTLNSLALKIQKHINSLTQERNEKEAILESLIEGVIAVDEEMRISYVNQTALKFLGKTDGDLIDKPFFAAQQPPCYNLLLACQQEKQPLTDTLRIKKEGQKLFLDIVAAPTKNNSGAILVLQDKTSHYRLLEMRKDFIANASHELKTPITIIRGFAETLQDNLDLPRETQEEVLNKIVRNCKRMTNIIKDLLTLTDVENIPSSRLIECDLYEIARRSAATTQDAYPTARIEIKKESDQDMCLLADPHLMELAFNNLIENAAKYSLPPAQIRVSLYHLGDKIRALIEDKGIGIPAADLEYIFQRFYTVDKAHSRRMGGSGLGLSIVETIIEKHYGSISVDSEPGKGTTFTIDLPIRIETN